MKEVSKLQDYYPNNLNGCYIINAGLIFRSLYFACRTFLSEKNREKIRVFYINMHFSELRPPDYNTDSKKFGGPNSLGRMDTSL